MSEPATFEEGAEFSTITLDDGEANVMSVEMLDSLNAALDRAEAAEMPLVLAGRDGIFSGGFDLATFEAGTDVALEMLRTGAETAERLLSFPRPVVVACTGHAVAMGLFLVLAGDERIGAAGEYTLQANEVEIGLTLPGFATELCRHRLTAAHFSRATLLAEPYTPEEAVAAGMLDQVAAPEDVLERAREKARSLERLDLEAHRATKQQVREEALDRMRAAIEDDVDTWTEIYA